MKKLLCLLLVIPLLLSAALAEQPAFPLQPLPDLTSADAEALARALTEALASAPATYVFRVADQSGDPVPEVALSICTDTSCVLRETDEGGVVTFTGAPGVYHVTVIDAPEGYSWDEDLELYTPAGSGEWVLTIHKD